MKKNIVIALLGILVVGLISYIVVDKSFQSNKAVEVKEEKEETSLDDVVIEEETVSDIILDFAKENLETLETQLITSNGGNVEGIEIAEYVITDLELESNTGESIVFMVAYDIKPTVMNANSIGFWTIGNGSVEGSWIVDKTSYVQLIKDGDFYKIASVNTFSPAVTTNEWRN